MRTIGEIIHMVKDGQRPEYDELRLAVAALSSLSAFDGMALSKLYDAEKEAKKPFMTRSAVWQYEEHFRRWKAALAVTPEKYLGPNHSPDNPDAVAHYRMANRLVEKIAAGKHLKPTDVPMPPRL